VKTLLTQSPRVAARLIRRGEIVAFPTETVYGLGADVFNERALKKIFAAKKRPADNPFIAHVAEKNEISLLAKSITPAAALFIRRFFPGPLTVVLPKKPEVPLTATAGLQTIAVRMPRHPAARALLRACGVPLAAPSANISGRPSSTTWQSVYADLNGRIGGILKGGRSPVGLESTVVDCTGRVPRLLRAGAISLEQLRKIVPSTRPAVVRKNAVARSPGMKYRHYSPRARVLIVAGGRIPHYGSTTGYIGTRRPPAGTDFGLAKVCRSPAEYAHELYAFFRKCDEANIDTVYCQPVKPAGIGRALMDRIRRASHL